MKDIRLVELPDRKVGVFTRPQGKMGGRGKIGYTVIDELNQLNAEVVDRAPLIKDHFIDEEWGGVNEVTILSNGLIGTLGHIARYDDRGNRHYYPMVFIYQPETNQITDMQMIAVRDDFPAGPAKRPDVADVLFSGGLVRRQNGKAELYVGVSDAEAHKAIIDDPFLKHER